MKRIPVWMLLLLAAAQLFPGCGPSKETLHLYTWADYVDPELVSAFEKENNCRVIIDTYDSNETMYAKLKAGASGYDLVVPSSYMAAIMQREGMLEAIDRKVLPNLAHVDGDYLSTLAIDKTMDYSVPYMLTNSGIAYLKSKVADVHPSWSVFEREDIKGRVTLMNDMRETLGAALKCLGYSLNTRDEEQIRQAKDVVLKWKKNIAKFDSEQYKPGIASGEFILVHGYSGDLLQAMDENEDIAYIQPVEGTSVSCDDLVILKEAKNKALAHAFINFLHDPARAAQNTTFVFYLCPNKDSYALLSDDIRQNTAIFVPREVLSKSEVIIDLGDDNQKYIKAWDEIKARLE